MDPHTVTLLFSTWFGVYHYINECLFFIMWSFPMFCVFNDQSTKRAKELWPLERAFLIGCFSLCFCLVFSRSVNYIGWVVVSLCLSFHICDTDVTTFTSASFSGFKAMAKISRIGGLVGKLCPTLATPWAVACQVPLPMGFPRQDSWSGLPFPPPKSQVVNTNPGSTYSGLSGV